MIRPVPLLLAASLALACLPAAAETAAAPASRHPHKPKAVKSVAPQPARASGGINQPSADFSTVEPPAGDDDTANRGPGSNVRPVMGSGGNIGFGTGF